MKRDFDFCRKTCILYCERIESRVNRTDRIPHTHAPFPIFEQEMERHDIKVTYLIFGCLVLLGMVGVLWSTSWLQITKNCPRFCRASNPMRSYNIRIKEECVIFGVAHDQPRKLSCRVSASEPCWKLKAGLARTMALITWKTWKIRFSMMRPNPKNIQIDIHPKIQISSPSSKFWARNAYASRILLAGERL